MPFGHYTRFAGDGITRTIGVHDPQAHYTRMRGAAHEGMPIAFKRLLHYTGAYSGCQGKASFQDCLRPEATAPCRSGRGRILPIGGRREKPCKEEVSDGNLSQCQRTRGS